MPTGSVVKLGSPIEVESILFPSNLLGYHERLFDNSSVAYK